MVWQSCISAGGYYSIDKIGKNRIKGAYAHHRVEDSTEMRATFFICIYEHFTALESKQVKRHEVCRAQA